MAAINGVGGSVKAGAVTLANITEWNLDLGGAVENTTPFQAAGAWEQNTATVKKWSGKAMGSFDSSDTTGQVALINGVLSTFAMSFMTDAVHNWAGNAILTNVVPKAIAKGIVGIEFTFTGTGAATYT